MTECPCSRCVGTGLLYVTYGNSRAAICYVCGGTGRIRLADLISPDAQEYDAGSDLVGDEGGRIEEGR